MNDEETDEPRVRATLDAMHQPDLEQDEVQLADGTWVLVRALTRDEVAEAREECTDRSGTLDETGNEYLLLSLSMVDPPMSVDDVRKWCRAKPAGDPVAVLDMVKTLSHLDKEAAKSRLPENRRERRAALRAGSRRKPR